MQEKVASENYMKPLELIALEKVANSFNRVEDPVVDQDSAKLLGAAGGLYGGYKFDPVMKRKGLLSKIIGAGASPVMRPAKMLAGMGLGALGAGLGARYLNKENQEDHEEALAQSYAQAANPYGGMPRYASARDYLPSTDEAVDQTLKGGFLGALASAILGTGLRRGAAVGALGNLGYNAYKKNEDQKEANIRAEQPMTSYHYDYGDLGKYASEIIEKNAKFSAKDILRAFGGGVNKTKDSAKKVMKSAKIPETPDYMKSSMTPRSEWQKALAEGPQGK
jgi:hypothetical protein